MKLSIPITKVDVSRREVWGIAAVEQLDRSGEILDYASSKPLFQQWSDDVAKASGGKSLGNVRGMHGKVAAGKVIAFQPNDAEKQFEIGTKIVDDNEWEKVCEGVYTGFSIGGDYERRWDDPTVKGAKRYTAKPIEVSIVDTPCIPGAMFEAIKADGTKELRKFADPKPEAPKPEAAAPLSDIDIDRLAKALEARSAEKAARVAAAEELVKKLALRKSMWDVGTLAQIMCQVASMEECLTWEADFDGTESKIPAQLREALVALKQIFLDLASEASAALVGDGTPDEAAKTAQVQIKKEVAGMVTELKKALEMAGASTDPEMKKMETHLKAIGQHVDKIAKCHADMEPHISALQGGEEPESEEKPEGKEAEKFAKAAVASLNKANEARFAAIEASMQKSNEVLALIAQRLVPTTVATTTVPVTKAADVPGSAAPAAITDPTEAIKAAHAAGMTRRIA